MSRYQNRPLVFQHYDMHRIVPTGPCVPVVGLPMSHLLARLSCVLTSCGHYATYILARLPGTTRPRQPKTIYLSNSVSTKLTNNTHQPQLILVPGKVSATPLSFHLLPTVLKQNHNWRALGTSPCRRPSSTSSSHRLGVATHKYLVLLLHTVEP